MLPNIHTYIYLNITNKFKLTQNSENKWRQPCCLEIHRDKNIITNKHAKPLVAGRPGISHLFPAFIPNCVKTQLSLQPRDKQYGHHAVWCSLCKQCWMQNTQNTLANNNWLQQWQTGTHTEPHLVIPKHRHRSWLTDNSYNINSFQKQTKPHPEISYGETDNPYNKQTVAFGTKEETVVTRKVYSRSIW